MMWNGAMSFVGVIMLFVLVTLLVAVVVGAVLIARTVSGGGDGGTSGALRILEERYARGEIDRDEFLQRRGDLLG
jgi:putative membrane protein